MEPDAAIRLTARKRRAVGLIAVSVLAIAAAGWTWIVPTLHLGDAAKPKTIAAGSAPSPAPAPVLPTTYDFATASIGWAVVARPAETKVFKTADGGKHWRPVSPLAGSYGATIQFLDDTHGFAVTSGPNRVYRTTDGGAHWTQTVVPEGEPYSATFTDRRRGSLLSLVARGHPVLYTTEDAGDTWRVLPDPPQDSYGPVFRNAEAWLSTTGPSPDALHVYTSEDRGLTWSPVAVPRPSVSRSSSAGPTFFNAEVRLLPGAGVAVIVSVGPGCGKPAPCPAADQGKFVSFDHGRTWSAVPTPPSAFNFRDIVYQDSVHWWALGSDSLFKSSDGGQTWQFTSSVAQRPQGGSNLRVFDAKHAYTQYSTTIQDRRETFRMSSVFTTSDGGLTWTRVSPPQL
jgi:photosystem II stability/assembly factor-like uncharacterized protein